MRSSGPLLLILPLVATSGCAAFAPPIEIRLGGDDASTFASAMSFAADHAELSDTEAALVERLSGIGASLADDGASPEVRALAADELEALVTEARDLGLRAQIEASARLLRGPSNAAALARVQNGAATDLATTPVVTLFRPRTDERAAGLVTGITDRYQQFRLDWLLARLDAFEAWLGIEGLARAPRDRVRVLHGAVGIDFVDGPVTTRLPVDRGVGGKLTIVWTFGALRWYLEEVGPCAREALVPEDAARAGAAAHRAWYAARYTSDQLGPQEVDGATLREHFGDEWGPLVIAKADLCGALVQTWLAGEAALRETEARERAGRESWSAEESEGELAILVAMSFRAAADVELGDAPVAHRSASGLVLVRLAAGGGIVLEEGGRWRVVPDVAERVARALVVEIMDVHRSGDRERARALVREGERMTPAIVGTVGRVVGLGGG